ncbi:CbtA family protein, partial [Geminicoccus flavidas]|uniref:CbtA family protein n=1 Tax=Geminicoccus flavidas TaxID=2506407 RepID=UPI00190F3380
MLSMFRRVVLTGIGAGLLAGLLVTFVQAFTTIPLIVAAEVYETGHDHEHEHEARLDGSLLVLAHSTVGEPPALPGEPEPVSLERRLSTLVANLVTGAGFGLLLAGAMTLAGHRFAPQRGLLWGMAGFATFTLA